MLEKYWAGNTSLQEEEEIKLYFKENPSLTPTGLFFRSLKKSAELESKKPFAHPKKRLNRTRLSVAATIVIGIVVGGIALQDANRQNNFEIEDPQEAYEVARLALMKMSSSLNEGSAYSGELKKLNKAEQKLKKEKL
ncbi:MAG: hypothetical protein GY816_14340 [Cytophagales bacterium]|nr:hypothetical protein [Cytophagales bacterium]